MYVLAILRRNVSVLYISDYLHGCPYGYAGDPEKEHTYWGPEASNVESDPNPGLLAYIEAARRGATVRVLLDSFRDDANLDSPRNSLWELPWIY